MAVIISGNGINMGGNPISNLGVDTLDNSVVNSRVDDLVRTKRSEARAFVRANREEV